MKPLESLGYVTPKDYSAFVKFNMLKGKRYRLKAKLTLAVLAVACVLLLFYGLAYQMKSLWIAAGAIVLCSVMFVYTLNVNVKRICSSNAKTVRAKQKTVFGKNGFVLELLFDNEEKNEHDEIFFDELERVYLAPKAIYLYIEKRSVIIIPIKNLLVTPAEARSFLEKYIEPQLLVICS